MPLKVPINIRRAIHADASQVGSLATAFGSSAGKTNSEFQNAFARIVQDPNWVLAVAELPGNESKLIGYVLAQDYQPGIRESFTAGRIRDLFVMPEYRGLGIASALFEYVIHWAKSRPQPMILDWQATAQAVPFYESHGFTADYDGDTREFPAFSLDLRGK